MRGNIEIVALLIGLTVLFILGVGLFVIGRWVYYKFMNHSSRSTVVGSSIKEIKEYKMSEVMEEKGSKIKSLKNSIGVRFFIIGFIAFLMLIPLSNISSIVDERSRLHNNVLSNIASQWGNPQVLTGPALIVPIIEKYSSYEKVKDKDGNEKMELKRYFRNRNIVILPKVLNKEIGLDEHYRYRGIYRSLVYASDIKIEGQFILPDISKISDTLDEVRYDKAYMVMGLSDTKAIEKVSDLNLNNNAYSFEPGTKLKLTGITSGFHAPVELNKDEHHYTFSFKVQANGSSYIRFSAFGEKTEVSIKSSWEHPSFQGAILPKERNISIEGFTATWQIPSLARNFPQTWVHELHNYDLDQLLTGVDFFEPVALYSLVERSIKYGVLFILLTFLTFLIFEMTQKSKLHYVQYVLIGLSLGLFFLTLLSLSEHIAFLEAYMSASAITILSITIYTWFSNKSLKQSLSILVMLTALYTILYSLLQLEDYALLMGTGLLLVVLFVLMWITRNLQVKA
ncbi:MAG: Inner membrane protein CreD-like protein [uncultured Sulfurovum sp.]|uniref:Inner membrane protein CreD-like protein n=1 Tax=uncultured Sulfurovum sp. TaxID=269237 RepID=A0A6S6S3B2_9BACT|nr:MAG: Inner membrane protein CreD-like protein [uncultured Sulfurovum sp.]